MEEPHPHIILLLSGKRKSGKDYLATKLLLKFGEEIATIVHLSAPLKLEYSNAHALDYNRLLDSENYKEMYRADMIEWGEQKRLKDPSYFCRLATENPWVRGKKIWIVSDTRRMSDLDHFRISPHVITIRIEADNETRAKRGFLFVPGIDDAESECGLDHFTNWDFVFNNSGGQDFSQELDRLIKFLDEKVDTVGDANLG